MAEELWIIDTGGICFFHRWINKETILESIEKKIQIKDQLFSGLLSGILTFTSKVISDKIEKIQMSEGKFLFFTSKNLIFIVRAKIKSSDNKLIKKIKLLEDLFLKKFEKKLDNFNGEVSSFKIFEEDLDEIFNKMTKVEKWGKGISNL